MPFPPGWAQDFTGPNFKPNGSEIEGSYTVLPDIDVSYARMDLP